MIIDGQGFVARRTAPSGRSNGDMIHAFRNWWLVKFSSNGKCGVVAIGQITIPKKYVGKKVRFKLVVMKE